jgi:hypothetical protein
MLAITQPVDMIGYWASNIALRVYLLKLHLPGGLVLSELNSMLF